MTDHESGSATKLAHGGRRPEWRGKLVNVPVERASSILFDDVADLRASRPGHGKYRYGLQGTATYWALAEALTELEPGAAGTVLYPTGLAAITGPLLPCLAVGRSNVSDIRICSRQTCACGSDRPAMPSTMRSALSARLAST